MSNLERLNQDIATLPQTALKANAPPGGDTLNLTVK